jgi:hypothetical protein
VQLCSGLWALGSLRRLRLYERLATQRFLGFADPSLRLDWLETEVGARVGGAASQLPGALIVLIVLAVPCYRLLWKRTLAPPFDPASFNWLFSVTFFFVYLGVVLMFLRFLNVWIAFSHLLRALALFPLGEALKALQARLSWIPFLELTGPMPKFASLKVGLERAQAAECDLDCLAEAVGKPAAGKPSLPVPRERLRLELRRAQKAFAQALAADAEGDRKEASLAQDACHRSLTKVTGRLTRVLEFVRRQPIVGKANQAKVAAWTTNAEQLMASRVAALAILVISVLRSLIGAVSVSVLLMLLAVSWYPFQSRDLLLTFNWAVILSIGAGTMWVFVQMDRDEVLSYLAGSDPGKVNLNRDFLLRIVTYVALPLLTLLATQFPGAGTQLTGWVQRALGAGH